jgi:lactate dehydrogenase-like 2-hydroxyacid dehydrogenase
MKIVFLDRKTLGDDITLEKFNDFGTVISYNSTKTEQTQERVKDADIVITNKVVIDKKIIDNSNIKLICVAATGMNNIDLEYVKLKNIVVENVAGYSTASVAQLTFSFMLQFINKISYYDNYVKSGGWENSDIFTHLDKPFYDLVDKKLGIIGFGTIGQKVANIGLSFGCHVSYYSTSGKNNSATYNQVELETLLKESDIISIHAPLNEKTMNLLNKSNLSLIKDKAILLNLGRGDIVNEQDILDELDKREIFFATDVVSKEPIEKQSPLLKIKNKDRILFTPHIGWASKEARIRLVDGIINNIKDFINGQ